MSFVVLFVGDGPLPAWMLASAVAAPTVIAGRAQESESLFGHGFGVIEIACADATQPVRSASEPIDSKATDVDPCHFRCWRDRLAAVFGIERRSLWRVGKTRPNFFRRQSWLVAKSARERFSLGVPLAVIA